MPRMLIVDLDGTVIPWSQRLSMRDVAAARALAAEGVHVSVATGRLFGGAVEVARALGVQGGIACMNGSEVVDVESEETLEGHYLDETEREILRAAMVHHDLTPALMRSRIILHGRATALTTHYLSIWSTELTEHGAPLERELWDRSADVLGVLANGEDDAVAAAYLAVRADLPELEIQHFRDFTGTTTFLKVRSARADKGTALRAMAAARGLTAADVVAVGDWNNDIPMLQAAGLSFAMAHAGPEVRAHADEALEADGETAGAIAEIARRVWDIDV